MGGAVRKLLLILLAFIAIFTLIRTIERPQAAEIEGKPQEEKVELSIKS